MCRDKHIPSATVDADSIDTTDADEGRDTAGVLKAFCMSKIMLGRLTQPGAQSADQRGDAHLVPTHCAPAPMPPSFDFGSLDAVASTEGRPASRQAIGETQSCKEVQSALQQVLTSCSAVNFQLRC
jgi:hypothetical protein